MNFGVKVYALENIDIYSGYNLSDSGMFWNVSSNGTTQKGYDLYTTNSQNAWYYAAPTSNISLTYLGGGMAITQCGYGLLENNYYSVSYVFNNGYTQYLHPYYTNKNPNVIGISDTNGTYRNDIQFTNISNGVEQVYYADGFYVDTFSLIFKANRNGSCITTTFSANDNISYTDYFFFRGIKVTNLGQNVPTTEQITNALSSNFTNVINNNNNNTNTIINNNNSNTTSIINNQNSNANSIINNQNANSQAEIQNANENTDKTIDSQKVCEFIDKSNIYFNNTYLKSDGNYPVSNFSDWGVTNYINVLSSSIKVLSVESRIAFTCFYTKDKDLIQCFNQSEFVVNDFLSIPSNATFVRFSIRKASNIPTFEICKNGNQATNDKLDDIMGADISDSDKQLPDSSSFEDYQDAENTLKNSISQADMSVLDIGIDSNSSNWVWSTLTSLLQSHAAIFGMVISILSIGIIKMALGR